MAKVTRDATIERVASWFVDHPGRLEEAIDGLVLPLEVLGAHRSETELIQNAAGRVAEAGCAVGGQAEPRRQKRDLPHSVFMAIKVLNDLGAREALRYLRTKSAIESKGESNGLGPSFSLEGAGALSVSGLLRRIFQNLFE